MRNEFDKKTRNIILWKGQVVMSRSERPLFNALFKRVTRFRPRSVLEVGFGLGISAQLIQKWLKPVAHDIVEIDEGIFEDLRSFAATRPGVGAILDDWMTWRAQRGYDFIFYDPFDYSEEFQYWPSRSAERRELRQRARRMRKLLSKDGIACIPYFEGEKLEDLPGFALEMFEEIAVPAYLLEDGRYAEEAGVACWRKAGRS